MGDKSHWSVTIGVSVKLHFCPQSTKSIPCSTLIAKYITLRGLHSHLFTQFLSLAHTRTHTHTYTHSHKLLQSFSACLDYFLQCFISELIIISIRSLVKVRPLPLVEKNHVPLSIIAFLFINDSFVE